jgi:hypothetical protein
MTYMMVPVLNMILNSEFGVTSGLQNSFSERFGKQEHGYQQCEGSDRWQDARKFITFGVIRH